MHFDLAHYCVMLLLTDIASVSCYEIFVHKQEIINASKQISTPIIEAILVKNNSKAGARLVKATIEKTTLGQVHITIYCQCIIFVRHCYLLQA
jgi:hypothetical protein